MNTSGKCFRQRRSLVDYRLDYSNEVTKATSKEDCQTQCINAQNFQCTGFAYRCVFVVIIFLLKSPTTQIPLGLFFNKTQILLSDAVPNSFFSAFLNGLLNSFLKFLFCCLTVNWLAAEGHVANEPYCPPLL